MPYGLLEVTGRAKELESVLRQLSRRPTDDLDVLKKRAQELDALVGDQALRRRRHDAEEKLQTTLLANARQLSVEFPEHEFRINFDSMRFELNFNSRWVGLDEIGSGSNWLAYHVAGATGLQQYFAQHSRPVPRLLMLDQPSQAWFPQEPATGSAGYKDEDLEAVRKLYWFLHNASQGSRAPQIIIVDHARLAQKWFQQAVIRDWHGAEGLVPSDW